MAMKVLWAAVLLAYGASPGAAMDPGNSAKSSSPIYTLDMAPDSIDDVYHGCDEEMSKKVKDEYLQKDLTTDDFKKAWDAAVTLYVKDFKDKIHPDPAAPSLTREDVIAIYVYTSVPGHTYRPLNLAVRTQGPQYTTTFRFHALHYYLTKAIQNLPVSSCPTVYRRTNVYFHDVAVNTQVRFGFFASSSMLKLEQTTNLASLFGDKTCFEIKTCMGGRVLEYSKQDIEAEVLIPPYEAFKVTDVRKKSKQNNVPCEVVYTLKSTGIPVSKYNCALFPK